MTGYTIIALKPKRVIVATAKDISSSSAWMTGAVAIIAELPHIAVPTAIKDPSFSEIPNFLVIVRVTIIAVIIQITIINNELPPSAIKSLKTNLLPKSMIPNFNKFLVANLIPGASIFKPFKNFLIIMPIKTANKTGLIVIYALFMEIEINAISKVKASPGAYLLRLLKFSKIKSPF